ncbi:hypothetical protein A6M14_12935 [Acinetobacter sp. Ac_877]|uniref:hypothetical protein n=2 Tax=Acinetobacter portensis TaxID=1839785 RepID=UPI00128CFCAF|nr:hypothetical protein [Acinetobacter portensis]MPW42597.1 hypothetical protein [Acinetobacter portensis]
MNIGTYNTIYFNPLTPKKNAIKDLSSNQKVLNSNMNIPSNIGFENHEDDIERISNFFDDLYKTHKDIKLHLFDSLGTLAVIQLEKNQVWVNSSRNSLETDFNFNCEVATTNALTKVDRKNTLILNDWIWNLFWNSKNLSIPLCPEDGHFKINYWPKPFDLENKKIIFQLTACFIQGGKISTIASQLNIPIHLVRRFIGANITINNVEKINIWDKHYTPPTQKVQDEDVGFIKDFFSSLRKKLHL